MADISMCKNKQCKDKDTCYRFNAVADKYYQSYLFIEGKQDKNTCGNYWKMKGVINSGKGTNNRRS